MKVLLSKDKMVAELKRLVDIQSKGSISMPEEKKIIRQIADLEASLPFAEPLEILDNQFGGVKEKKKVLSALIRKAGEVRDRYRNEEKDMRKILDARKEESTKTNEEKIPGIDKIKEEYRAQIKETHKKIKDSEKKQREDWDRWYEQQELIKEIQWMKKVQDRLKRDQEWKQREDEERKQRELDEAQYKDVPYKEEIDLCDLLIKYALKLQPQEKVIEEDQTKFKTEALDKALKSDEWKKEKVQLLVSRREKDDDLYTGKPKKNKNQAQKQQTDKNANVNLALNHQMDVLTYFDSVKVAPPLDSSKLPITLQALKEKKEYYQKLSETEQANADNKTEKKEEAKTADRAGKRSPQKKQHPSSLKEEDFPMIKLN